MNHLFHCDHWIVLMLAFVFMGVSQETKNAFYYNCIMARILRFEFNVTIDDLDLGELEGVSMDTFSEKIREAVKNLSESLDLRLEYGKVFDLDQRTGFYSKTLLDMSEAMDNAKIIEIDEDE